MNIVDEYCSLPSVNIHKSGKILYACRLNQTNLTKNNNKFYIIQLLSDGSGKFYLYCRYGRVGEKGIFSYSIHFSEHVAVREFQKKFRIKTGNQWTGDVNIFAPKPGKYVMMDIATIEDEVIDEVKKQNVDSKLSEKVYDFISTIGNKKLMKNTIKEFNIDSSRLPLGKISSKQISKAHSILKKIESWTKCSASELKEAGVEDPDNFISHRFSKLSSEFWTLIPYACGRSSPPVISSLQLVEKYAEFLEVLEGIKIAGKIVEKTNNVDDIYESLDIRITEIDRDSFIFSMLETYISNSHASTHRYSLEILEIYDICKEKQDNLDKQLYFKGMSNHKLLFHGSRMTNYIGILSEGIRIPLSSQVLNGSVLGYGIYFADSISKSYNYCMSSETENIGYVIICEVALGLNPHIVTQATHDKCPTAGYTSRIAQGRTVPDPTEMKSLILESGEVCIPCGKLVNSSYPNSGFMYNEYVIYDSRQYRFRYLVKLKSSK